jgi:glycosyltransferase involved in cell wall biosynthesis
MKLAISEKRTSICLNMIVKNESHIIEKTLLNLCDKIKFSYWVICDTGSTDNTPELITNFFKNKNIPGQLFYDKWQDFAHNRTIALEKAFNKTDFLLVFDADDELCGEIILPSTPNYDEYQMKFGTSSGTMYTRVLLINNRKRFQYFSVIHEYISCKEQGSTSAILDGNYYVISGRSGNRGKDPDKYLKDAIILEKAYK